jgi:hypothetical protein
MQIIPLAAVPNQSFNVQLGTQNCTIAVYQNDYGLFLDLLVNGVPTATGALCLNLNRIVRSLYLGFIGDLTFMDNQGNQDPNYLGLGTRFSLAYLEAADLPPGVG